MIKKLSIPFKSIKSYFNADTNNFFYTNFFFNNRYFYSIFILIIVYVLELHFYLEFTLLLIVVNYLAISLAFKVFRTPKVLSFFDFLAHMISPFVSKVFDTKDTGKAVVAEGIDITFKILRRKYFGLIKTILYFSHSIISFTIMILSSAVILQNFYLENPSYFNLPYGREIGILDFLLLSFNSYFLIDYSTISSNSFFISLLLSFHSFIFITITLLCLFMLALFSSYESIEIESKHDLEQNELAFSMYKFNNIIQTEGIISGFKFLGKRRSKRNGKNKVN